MEILAIIPARGGSKGLPGKNIRPLNGIPLIAYSVAAAHQSELVNRVVCTTDSPEIAKIANNYGAEIPFLRPREISGDNSTDLEAFLHLLNWYRDHERYEPDIIVQLRPTSPLRPLGFIDKGITKLLSNGEIESLRTVCPAPITPYKMWSISKKSDFLEPLLHVDGIAEPYNEPRQSLPEVWWQVGLLDVIRSELIIKHKSMSGRKISFLKVDPSFAIDIDNLEDFKIAEQVIGSLKCVKP